MRQAHVPHVLYNGEPFVRTLVKATLYKLDEWQQEEELPENVHIHGTPHYWDWVRKTTDRPLPANPVAHKCIRKSLPEGRWQMDSIPMYPLFEDH